MQPGCSIVSLAVNISASINEKRGYLVAVALVPTIIAVRETRQAVESMETSELGMGAIGLLGSSGRSEQLRLKFIQYLWVGASSEQCLHSIQIPT